MTILEPADVAIAGIPGPKLALAIVIVALALFAYVMSRRIDLLKKAMPDPRLSDIGERVRLMLVYGFGQLRQPRYMVAGVIHILVFAGFMILSIRSLTLLGNGFSAGFPLPLLGGPAGHAYEVLKDHGVLVGLAVCIVAIVRRAVFKPARYAHAPGQGHEAEAYIILGLVCALMLTDIVFDGSKLALAGKSDALLFPAATLGASFMTGLDAEQLNSLHIGGYWSHILIFFGFLNYLPMSKHFHVITAIPNVFFANLHRGTMKSVR